FLLAHWALTSAPRPGRLRRGFSGAFPPGRIRSRRRRETRTGTRRPPYARAASPRTNRASAERGVTPRLSTLALRRRRDCHPERSRAEPESPILPPPPRWKRRRPRAAGARVGARPGAPLGISSTRRRGGRALPRERRQSPRRPARVPFAA